MPVPDAHLLFAVRRAHARIHVEHDASGRTASMNAVGEIGERGQVFFGRQPARLKAPHLARRRGTSRGRLPADDPAHRGIMPKSLGVVDVLVSCKPPEHGLSQHSDQGVSAVLARSRVGKPIASRLRKAESIVKLAIGEQPSISEVTTEPRNWSVTRRSKSSLSASPLDSPAGFVMTAALESA
jgi:hypothetical protein